MAKMISLIIFCLASLGAVSSSPPHPHIIMFVIDDLGWNDVSYHGAEFSTPNIDRLALSGVQLSQYYVNRVCSPTRSSLMAGRYAYNMGLDGSVIVNGHDYSLPLNHSTLGDLLHQGGYSTHAIGKWDLGMYRWSCTPTYRGFDTFYGYYNAAEDYLTHTVGRYLDFRNNTKPETTKNGTYSTTIFTREAERLIMEHDVSKPFFLYQAYQAVHGPLEAPQHYIDMCPETERPDRRVFCGMMMALDEGIGNITRRLEARGMMNDTLIVFTTDNGGQNGVGGNNWPLRGNKATVWEGGVRGVGFIHGTMLKNQGSTYNGLLHATDWLPTLVEGVAKLELDGLRGNASIQPLDGFNVWDAVNQNATSPRHEILLTLNPPIGPDPKHPLKHTSRGTAAIRVDNWKLIIGQPNCSEADWGPSVNVSTDKCPSGWVHPTGIEIPPPANPSFVWLFDIEKDPLEKNDVHDENPDVVARLRERIEAYNATHINQVPPGVDPASNPKNFGGVWTPWVKEE